MPAMSKVAGVVSSITVDYVVLVPTILSCVSENTTHFSIETIANYYKHTKLLVYTIYQVSIHPLRNYPGPLIAKLTDGYSGFHTFRGRLHLNIWQNQQRYGMLHQ